MRLQMSAPGSSRAGLLAALAISSPAVWLGGCGVGAGGEAGYEAKRRLCLLAADVHCHQPPRIAAEQVRQAETLLRPGDIILRRREGNLTNLFIPGFFTHSAIYLGRPEELRRMGLYDRSRLADALRRYERRADDGRANRIIHIDEDGAAFASLGELLTADAAMALRPRLEPAKLADAVAAALEHLDRPYDFDFDLQTADRETCVEMLWRVYGELLEIRPVTLYGRETLTADQIAETFRRGGRGLGFVWLLRSWRAGGPAEFCAAGMVP